MLKNNPVYKLVSKAEQINADGVFVEIFSQDKVKLFAAELNVKQLSEGFMNSEGVQLSSIGGDYSAETIRLSIENGRPKKGVDKVDLNDEGDYHKSFHVSSVDASGFIITSDPFKDDGTDLLDEWGPEVEGLTFDSIDKLVAFVIPLYQEWLKNYLFAA